MADHRADLEQRLEQLRIKLHEEETRFRNIITRHADGILIIDSAGIVRFANPAAGSLLGRPAQSLLGTKFGFPVVVDEQFEIDVVRDQGETIVAEVRLVKTEWDGQPSFLVCLRNVTERRRVQQAEREQRVLAEALRDTAEGLRSSLNLDEVLDRILNNVSRVVPNDAADLMLVESGVTRTARYRGYSERGLDEWILSLHFAVSDVQSLRDMAATGQPLVISDTAAYPGWVSMPEVSWQRSYVGAPIRVQDRVIGFLNLTAETPGFYLQIHADRLRAFADQVGPAIESGRLFQVERVAREQVEVLHEIVQTVGASLDRNEVLRRSLSQLRRLLEFDTASVLLFGQGTRAEVISGVGSVDESLTTQSAASLLEHNPILQAMSRDLRPVFLSDVREVEGWTWTPGADYVRSFIAAPMITRGQLIGALMVDSRRVGFFGPAALQIVQDLAGNVTVAVENARLFEVARQRMAEQSALLAASTAVSSSLDLATVLTRLAEHMGRAIDVTSVYIGDWDPETRRSTILTEYYGPLATPHERVSDLGITYYWPVDFGEDYDQWLRAGRVAVIHGDDHGPPVVPEDAPQTSGFILCHETESSLFVG